MTSFWLWLVSIVVMLVGVVGTIIPAIPGMGLVFLGILIYSVGTGFATIEPLTMILFGVVAALGWLASFFGSAWGARAGGGTRAALVGTFVGAIAGIFLMGPPGLVVGAFVGALIGALASGQKHDQALQVAAYSVIGILGGAIMQFILALSLIVAFLIAALT